MLNNLRGRKNKIEIQNNLAKAKQDVIAYRAEVERLKRELANTDKYIKGTKLKTEKWTTLNKQLEEAKRKLQEARQAASEFQFALNNFSPRTFGQVFSTISSWVAHAGSAMQSFGNALTKLTNPFRRFTTGLIFSAGYKALDTVLSGFGGAFERYDTMQNYAKTLKALGLDAEQTFKVFSKQEKAQTAIENLNDAVLGLPTGLDEIVAAQKVYAGSTGEMVKSTKLAIAANNTFLASSMGSREQRFMQRYMASLASGAELTKTQWQSIGRIAPLALNAIADELQVTTDDLRNGRVAGEEFLDAFIKVGTEGKIQAAANVMKTTWEGLTANIQNATKRMGEGVLKALDEAFVSYNGRNLVQNLLGFDAEGNEVGGGIKHFINSISDGLQEWVKAHPEEIMNFFNSLKAVDWKSLIKGIGEGFLQLAQLTEKMANFLEGKDLSKVGKFMVMGNVWGKALTIAGGLLKGTRHLWGFIGAASVMAFLKARGFSRYGLLGMLGRFIGGTAEGAAETATIASTTARTAPKMGKFMTGLSAVFKGWAQIATMIGGSAFVAWGSMKLIKGAVKSFKQTVDILNEVDWDMGKKALKGIAGFLGGVALVSTALSRVPPSMLGDVLFGEVVAGLFTTIAFAFADVDMAFLKGTFKKVRDMTQYLNEAVDNINQIKAIDDVGGVKTKVKNAVTTFSQLNELLGGKFNAVNRTYEGGLTFDKKNAKKMEQVADAIENVISSVEGLNKIAGLKVNINGIRNMMPQFESAMSSLGGTWERLPKTLMTDSAVEGVKGMSESVESFKSAIEGLIGEGGILARIPELVGRISNLQRSGNLEALERQMESVGNAIKAAYNALQYMGDGGAFAENLNGFREGFKSLKFALMHLQDISGLEVSTDVIEKIQGVLNNIETAFDVGVVGRIQENINTMVTSIQTALDSFKELNGDIEVDVKVKLAEGFTTSANKVIDKINKKKEDIKNSTSGGISITIPVSVHFSVSTNFGSALARIKSLGSALANAGRGQHPITPHLPSTGGLNTRNGILYRSGGGSAFRPRGTDKIPAMLTEGEYVHRKQAVDFFGVDFMRAVNNMDVRGAMNALLTKAGTSVGVGRQSIVNHTINNNQRVNMTVTTNNPNFAGARMGRFVGAL